MILNRDPGSAWALVTFQPLGLTSLESAGTDLQEQLTFWAKEISPSLEADLPWPGEVGRTGAGRFSILWEGVEEAALMDRVADS